jgi:geranylgeranyl diphosphate synthase type I
MLTYFENSKKQIHKYLIDFFALKQKKLGNVNSWGKDLSKRLPNFANRGKMIRGGLVFLGHDLFQKNTSPELAALGSAMELLQSALLIHDDIMDNDYLRRGQPTLFAQYEALAKKEKLTKPKDLGVSLGICSGDVAFFLAYEIINNLNISAEKRQAIIRLVSEEMSYVGLAQMQDIYFSTRNKRIKEFDILKLYMYKTGRYTFSLPLLIGAILAGGTKKNMELLENIGENLGIIFQLKDDELGLFGNPRITGKPAGADIKEGKKTIYYYRLQKKLYGKTRLLESFGNKNLSEKEIRNIQKTIISLGIKRDIHTLAKKYIRQTTKLIKKLKTNDPQIIKVLKGLLLYSLERSK